MDKKIDETIDLLREQVADNDLHSIILVSPKDGKDAIVALTGTGIELLEGVWAVICDISDEANVSVPYLIMTLIEMFADPKEETE